MSLLLVGTDGQLLWFTVYCKLSQVQPISTKPVLADRDGMEGKGEWGYNTEREREREREGGGGGGVDLFHLDVMTHDIATQLQHYKY